MGGRCISLPACLSSAWCLQMFEATDSGSVGKWRLEKDNFAIEEYNWMCVAGNGISDYAVDHHGRLLGDRLKEGT